MNKSRYTRFILLTLEMLWQVLVHDRKCQGSFYEYITDVVPPPSYCYVKWTDWIRPFVLERIRVCTDYQYQSEANKKEKENAVRVLSLLDEEEKIVKGRKSDLPMVAQDSTDVSQAPAQAQ